jgi:hypothetical protein
MTVIKKNVFAEPSFSLKAAMVGLVVLNLVLWSGVLLPGVRSANVFFYQFLRSNFWYIVLAEAVAVFFVFSDLILAWDDRPKKFRTFHLVFSAMVIALFVLKLFAFIFDFLLPFFV